MIATPRRCLGALLMVLPSSTTARADDPRAEAIRAAVTFYASFDESLRADVAGGAREPQTRFNDETQPGRFVFQAEVDRDVFRINPQGGVAGGALEPTDVLPRNGRIYYPLRGNVAFDPRGWSGAVSVWCRTDPNRLLKTPFCDPIQITQKGANDGGLWFDYNDAKPRRDMRHGAFPVVPAGQKPIAENDPQAPLVRVPQIDWSFDQWHHVVLTWKNFDTGRPDAESSLYVDGKKIGRIGDRAIAMGWDVDRAGIYTAINYLGRLDELAIFKRELSADDVRLLHAEPSLLQPLKRLAPQ